MQIPTKIILLYYTLFNFYSQSVQKELLMHVKTKVANKQAATKHVC